MNRWYRPIAGVQFKFIKKVYETEKAILFEMEPKIMIWVPKSKIKSMDKKSFTVTEPYSHEVKLKIYAEKQ